MEVLGEQLIPRNKLNSDRPDFLRRVVNVKNCPNGVWIIWTAAVNADVGQHNSIFRDSTFLAENLRIRPTHADDVTDGSSNKKSMTGSGPPWIDACFCDDSACALWGPLLEKVAGRPKIQRVP